MSMDDETTDRDGAAGRDDDPAPAAGSGEATGAEAADPGLDATDVDALIGADTPPSDAPDTADASGLVGIVEALVFASPEPITVKALVKLLDGESTEDVAEALEELKRRYRRSGGLQLVEVANGYQIVTRPELHVWVRRLFQERTSQKLSVQ